MNLPAGSVREYAREFSGETAGVALIESSSPQQIDELPGFRTGWEEDKRAARRALWMGRLRVWSGWERLLGHCDDPISGLDCRPAYVEMDECESPYFEDSSRQAGRLTKLSGSEPDYKNRVGDVPLLVITGEKQIVAGANRRSAEASVWDREQEASKALSPLSWRVIARGSGHIVPIDRPDLVIVEMTRMIGYLRGEVALPFGSTETR